MTYSPAFRTSFILCHSTTISHRKGVPKVTRKVTSISGFVRSADFLHILHAQIRAPNTVIGRIWTRKIWSSGVSLKRSCKMPKCSLEANPYQERRLVIPIHVTWSIPIFFWRFQFLNFERCQHSCMPLIFPLFLSLVSWDKLSFLMGVGWACVGHGAGVRID